MITQIYIKRGPVEPEHYDLLSKDQLLPLQQHWLYGKALSSFGADIEQIIAYKGDKPIALTMITKRKLFGFIQFSVIFRGPLWLNPDISEDDKVATLRCIMDDYKKWRWQFCTILPEQPESKQADSLMKRAGLRKSMTGFSTAWVDLRGSEAELHARLKGKWRNQLKKAEAADFEIVVGSSKPDHYNWLFTREQEQRSDRRYQATPIGLVPSYVLMARANKLPPLVSITAHLRREKIAGALFLIHGNSATYHIGWSGEAGRDMNAQNRVLWAGMLALREHGVLYLDLGGMNTAELANVTRFKLGIGADPITLAGAYM